MAALAAVRGQSEPVYDLFAPGLFDDDEARPSPAELHVAELMAKYGQPVGHLAMAREYRQQEGENDVGPGSVT